MKMKFIQNCTNSLATIALVLGNLVTVQSLPEKANAIEPPPDRGTPQDRSGATITRPPKCLRQEVPGNLSALVMNNGNDYTLSVSPTLWIYVPFSKDSISSIDLTIYDETERKTLYTQPFRSPQTPGYIPIPLSPSGKNILKVSQTYRWYVQVKCKASEGSGGAKIKGWIQRKAITPALKQQLGVPKQQQYKIYQQNQIWYDAIDSLARAYFSDRNNPELKKAWTDLLKKLQVQ